MSRLIPKLILLLLLLPPSIARAESFLVNADGAQPGMYTLLVQVSPDGSVAVERVRTVVVLSDGSSPPPSDGSDVDSVVSKLRAAADAVIGDSDRVLTASNYAVVFGFVRDQIRDGTITNHANIEKLTTVSLEQVAATNGVANQWKPFVDLVKEEIADRGVMTADAWTDFLTKAEKAMQLSSGGAASQFRIGQLLLQLIQNEDLREILLPLLLKLLAGL